MVKRSGRYRDITVKTGSVIEETDSDMVVGAFVTEKTGTGIDVA